MLRPNPLQPPRPFLMPPAGNPASQVPSGLVSAEDFDQTGILSGVDPCESRYWWLPELYVFDMPIGWRAGEQPAGGQQPKWGRPGRQATSRSWPRPPAAA